MSAGIPPGGDVINRNLFLVRGHVGLFKAANNFDIYDPQTNQLIMECRPIVTTRLPEKCKT